MIIKRAIVSTNDNLDYYQYWPLVAKAWRNIGIEPTICVIGNVDIDASLGTVVRFSEIDGIESSFISQVIRFLIPTLYPEDVCIIGDIDMIPLSKTYFTETVLPYDNKDFVVFSSDAYLGQKRYPMCYLAALGSVFSEIINLKRLNSQNYSKIIADLHSLNLGWDTDELFFTEKLLNWKESKGGNLHLLNRGWENSIASNRIDRACWKIDKNLLTQDFYLDSHLPRGNRNKKLILPIQEYVGLENEGLAYGKRRSNLIQRLNKLKVRFF